MRVFWKDGLRFESADKRYKFRLGGRIHYDMGFFAPDDATRNAVEDPSASPPKVIEDGSEIRRARIEMSGEVGDRVDWATSFDFGGSNRDNGVNLRNAYVGVKDISIGNIRAGQYKEPYGLEQLTSSNNITFIERSLMNPFVPAFNAGVMVFDQAASERVTWAAGVFRTGTDDGEVSKGDGEYAVTARVTGLPMYSQDGKSYVHLGLDFSERSPTDDSVTFSAKPEANLAPNYVSAKIPAETVDLIGAEAAWATGPFKVSGEYTLASIEGTSGSGDPDLNGYYVQASYFLTGESHPYSKATGAFGAVKPNANAFGKEGGHGAWELGVRYSAIDLSDSDVDKGELNDVTLGVNWYLNPNARLMFNYIRADLEPNSTDPDGTTDIFLVRAQFAF
jgi:phosphate-selective porin OprO/OprP